MDPRARMMEITDTLLQMELAKLRDLSEAAARIQDEIDALSSTSTQTTQADGLTDGRTTALWLRWVSQERRRLQLSLAQARAAQEMQRRRAELAFGKAEVAKAIHAKVKAAARLEMTRKRESAHD